jgi:sugar phosphate isomerase/epimerase
MAIPDSLSAQYRRGAFIHVVQPAPAEWERDVLRVRALPLLQHLEIWIEHIPGGRNRSILRDLTKGVELIVHGPFIHGSVVTHVDAIADLTLRRWTQTVDLAVEFGVKVVTFHTGTFPAFDSRQTAFERLIKRFDGFAGMESPVVTLENMPIKRGAEIECLGALSDLEALKAMLPHVRFTLDIGHCLQNGDRFEEFITKQISSIENIHLHDGEPGGRSHLRLGTGVLDLYGLLSRLRRVGYRKYVSLETISFEDTYASWQTWLNAEMAK